MNEPLIQISLGEFLLHELQKEIYQSYDLSDAKGRLRMAESIAIALRENWVKIRV